MHTQIPFQAWSAPLLDRLAHNPSQVKIGVVGLGYVGLPLAVSLARTYTVIGMDRNQDRIRDIDSGRWLPEPMTLLDVGAVRHNLKLVWEWYHLAECDVVIVAVPTDIDQHKVPDLEPLITTAKMLNSVMPERPWGLCIESTVWPGCTEEVVIPMLNRHNRREGFFYGFSPERIVPGAPLGKHHGEGMGLHNTNKLVSGSCPDALEIFRTIYSNAVTDAKVVECTSVKVAEASKMLENIQRDVNIALINEYARACTAVGISIHDVLDAAKTKWNFHPYSPGLVGGHCIGVDPYYMLHRAQKSNLDMPLVRAAREVNEAVPQELAVRVVRDLQRRKCEPVVLVLGTTFKENCDDMRNSKVVDLVRSLEEMGCMVHVHDPVAPKARMDKLYGARVLPEMPQHKHVYGAVVLAVPHQALLENITIQWLTGLVNWQDGCVWDLKRAMRPRGLEQLRAYRSW